MKENELVDTKRRKVTDNIVALCLQRISDMLMVYVL